ncbi:MAG: MBL fold metallo-hydrolase [Bacteroidetes bacterium 46-16]|nr:MAG: MBL fold metallo-hydrolase [Bacteroidetes bacterium 46-16]
MKVEQIYTGCLAQGAYYITSEGEAAIVDPLREIQPYLDKAAKDGVKIKYIFETHFHADFVSGHLDLARATGATIVYGPTAKPSFEAHVAKDNETFKLGAVNIKLLHTPGHTLESSCYLLQDEQGKDNAVFTGDTLFIGDVGRPDLAQKAANMTQEELAALLFDSLRNKVMPLADDVTVYPAHGEGSACGKNMSKETVSTIGMQKRSNYALRADMSKDEFIKEVTDGLLPPPVYFPMNVQMNKEGYDSINDVLKRGTMPLSVDAFEAAANETGALILDTRNPEHFVQAFIPNSINIGIDGTFAPWVGALIPDIKQTVLLVTEPGREEETVIRMARVGYDHVIGYLEGGFEAWRSAGKETDRIESISAFEFAHRYNTQPGIEVIDVRRPGEYNAGHLSSAKNLPLDYINEHMASFPKDKTFYLHCAGGYRSVIAASILKSRGYEHMVNIASGFSAIKESGIAAAQYVSGETIQ